MKVLVLNAGSSSYKISLFELSVNEELSNPKKPIWECESNDPIDIPLNVQDIDIIGHRIVHGGGDFQTPTVITQHVKEAIQKYTPLAPIHNPKGLEGIERMQKRFRGITQVAVFDTAFHSTLSQKASTYPGPYEWLEKGIKRYGFHGISYEYCAAKASKLIGNESLKLVCCHLGNGASCAAINNGKSIDTTMGFTPLDGLMMGTRPGSLDPGILLFLQDSALFNTINFESGLKGISGKSSDMRDILELLNEPRVKLAYDMYIHSLKKNIASMIASLDGIEALIFTAGIGEHCPEVRKSVCCQMNYFGFQLDEQKNATCKKDMIISLPNSKALVGVIETKEEWCIAFQISKMRNL